MTRLKQCTTPRPNRVTGTLRADFRTLFTFQEKFVVVLRFARSCYYFKVVVSKHFYKPPIQSSNPNMACFKEINDDLLKLGVKFICYFVVQKVSWIVYCGQTSWKAKHVGYLVIPLFGMFGMSLKLEENILKLNVTIMKCYDMHYLEDVIFLYLQHFISPDLHYYPDSKHELVRVAIRAVQGGKK